MQGLYGSLWLDRWRSGEAVERNGSKFDRGLLIAKATWAEELAGFADQPERIQKALESCRHRELPPTLPAFLDLCRQQHADAPLALAAPRMASDAVAPHIAKAAEKVAKQRDDPTGWAKRVPNIRGTWERFIVELVEEGDARFVPVLADHVRNGVIKSERAKLALKSSDSDAAA